MADKEPSEAHSDPRVSTFRVLARQRVSKGADYLTFCLASGISLRRIAPLMIAKPVSHC